MTATMADTTTEVMTKTMSEPISDRPTAPVADEWTELVALASDLGRQVKMLEHRVEEAAARSRQEFRRAQEAEAQAKRRREEVLQVRQELASLGEELTAVRARADRESERADRLSRERDHLVGALETTQTELAAEIARGKWWRPLAAPFVGLKRAGSMVGGGVMKLARRCRPTNVVQGSEGVAAPVSAEEG